MRRCIDGRSIECAKGYHLAVSEIALVTTTPFAGGAIPPPAFKKKGKGAHPNPCLVCGAYAMGPHFPAKGFEYRSKRHKKDGG